MQMWGCPVGHLDGEGARPAIGANPSPQSRKRATLYEVIASEQEEAHSESRREH